MTQLAWITGASELIGNYLVQAAPLTGLAEWLAPHPNSPFERPPKLLAEFFTKRRFLPFGCTIGLIKRGIRVT
jgi:hypothetical protein